MMNILAEPAKYDVTAGASPIPLTVLTGFLGAGKTTLLNRILNGSHGLRIAVLVNDFGSVNIDAQLVAGVKDDVISLANGCVCCSIRDDLVEAVMRGLELPERPEYVVLEASGVADPAAIAATFMDPHLDERIRLDSITTVVDAEQLFAVPELMRLKLWQIGCADLLVLNKVDLVSREEVAKIKNWLSEHFLRYRLIEATQCEVPLEILLAVGRFDAARVASSHGDDHHDTHACHHADCDYDSNHGGTFSTWTFESSRPLSLEALRDAARRLPASVYRCKGVIYTPDAPGHRAVLQTVGKRVNLIPDGAWVGRPPRTQIVIIGAAGTLEPELLLKTFASCMVSEATDAGQPTTLTGNRAALGPAAPR